MPECPGCGARIYPSDGTGCGDCGTCDTCGKIKRDIDMYEYGICKDCYEKKEDEENEDEY